jgi:hypothetical protein
MNPNEPPEVQRDPEDLPQAKEPEPKEPVAAKKEDEEGDGQDD